ncbi:SAM-dependent methyltransferase [Pseudonocardia endophytica]|uniref:S-adenosyl methyltransferase n=1 Tax=Pseudonocardia endophytica TaxID=401976 RepID=A0A4V2PHY0_PSEEN|nr:SAM-dependent methyltransferase [Pseudonocardia endophytica]TCK22466.1 S-adenosyl methyltransferase [Pseudonocardia endophytica]
MVEATTPSYIDPTKASIARAYDYALGGKDHYEIDRETIHQVDAIAPGVRQVAIENRNFLIRALRFLVSQTDVRQFLDCGSGLPTAENTHQVVQRVHPDAKVVYVDNDPTVVAHGRALLEDNEQTLFLPADIFTPQDVVGNEQVRRFLDFDEPIALIHNGTIHHYNDPARSPESIVDEYVEALPSGSYVVIAHFFDPDDNGEASELARTLEDVLLRGPVHSGRFRTRAELEPLFAGLEMVEPGLVLCADWWPDGPRLKPTTVPQRVIAGGVGRKP